MKSNFEFLTLSIYYDIDFKKLTENIKKRPYYKLAIKNNEVVVFKDKLKMERYFNPESGEQFEMFSWWSNRKYPKNVFLTSNSSDGLYLFSKRIRDELHCSLIRISMSASLKEEYQCFWFQYICPDGKERVIYALKEDRWVFYEEGDILPFENPEYYKRRRIRDRINNEIIIEYLAKCGINFYDIDSDVDQCMTLERKKWNSE